MVYSIEKLKELVTPIAIKYALPAVYLFGSYAKGEATEDSDIDILVDKTGASVVGLFAMGGLYNDLTEAVDKKIDLLTTNALEQESAKERTPLLIKNINNEKIKIYG